MHKEQLKLMLLTSAGSRREATTTRRRSRTKQSSSPCSRSPTPRDPQVSRQWHVDSRPRRSKKSSREEGEDFAEVREHYTALNESQVALLLHVTSQHSILDALYGDQGSPMPSWSIQTTPEVGVSDQQHTGRCWIFATLAVLGHVFRAQYGISNQRATFSEGYLGFWDLYEKSRLFLNVAYDTRCVPLNDPSLCDILKGGISDGGDYIFCLNLMERYGVVPTEYYPNSSYGSMSTEALVTLINQVLRDNVITLRKTGDRRLITPMLTNIFSILSFGLGTPPMPWKKLNWQLDQNETIAHYAGEVDSAPIMQPPPPPPSDSGTTTGEPTTATAIDDAADREDALLSSLPSAPMQPSRRPPSWGATKTSTETTTARSTYPVSIPQTSGVSGMEELISALNTTDQQRPSTTAASQQDEQPPSPGAMSDQTAAPMPETDLVPSSTARVLNPDDEQPNSGSELSMRGALLPPRPVVDIPTRNDKNDGVVTLKDTGCAKKCDGSSGFSRMIKKITGCRQGNPPAEGSGEFFSESMEGGGGCLMGRRPPCASGSPCRLAYTVKTRCPPASVLESPPSEQPLKEDALLFDYTPRDFYKRYLTGVRYVPLVCDSRFPSGTRLISNDANMFGGRPSLYLNVTIDDIENYAIASLKRNIPVWFACDVKKQLTPEGGRMCVHRDRLASLLPRPHVRGTKLDEIRHFNATANHALLISAVALAKEDNKTPTAWRIVNSWGEIGRNSGVFVACADWFREHVYAINAVYDTLSTKHKADIDTSQSRPTVRLGPFDPSVI